MIMKELYIVQSQWQPNKQQAPDEYLIPLKHPVTGKDAQCLNVDGENPPSTMKELVSKNGNNFGEDDTKQPERKYCLKRNMDENIPSIIPFGGSDDALLKS